VKRHRVRKKKRGFALNWAQIIQDIYEKNNRAS
jgi:hypothetical protein